MVRGGEGDRGRTERGSGAGQTRRLDPSQMPAPARAPLRDAHGLMGQTYARILVGAGVGPTRRRGRYAACVPREVAVGCRGCVRAVGCH